MIGDLLINGNDAYGTWGVRLDTGFSNALLAPPPLKEFIENKSRLEDGKRVVVNNPRVEERDVTLPFTIEGNTINDYLGKYRAFVLELQKGEIHLKVPALGNEVYRLIYKKSLSYALSSDKTFSKLSVMFNEPNPTDR